MNNRSRRLAVVSNRLPFVFSKGPDGDWQVKRGSGGLVSALLPILRHRGGTWIGWTGTAEEPDVLAETIAKTSAHAGYNLRPVHLSAEEAHNFYQGFSNEVIWPLFHDLHSLCNFDPAYWSTYCEVNRKFAQTVIDNTGDEDFIWVHDYHLINVAEELRKCGRTSKVGFFLHIPFPPLDLFAKLPWRGEIIRALLQFDLVGFQTWRDRRNFLQCLRALVSDVQVEGKGQIVDIKAGSRQVRIGAFPISIDFKAFAKQAAQAPVVAKAKELHALLPNRRLVLGIDRLDYTKGIPQRIHAFHNLLTRYPQMQGKVSLIQVVVPSRVGIPKYDELKTTIEQLVGKVNGEFMRPGGWVPVWYFFGDLTRTELLAYYRAADIALITPLKDGMNLVAKEYCASNVDANGVLILSEFAGSAAQLRRGALLVNPHDIEGVANAILQAYETDSKERQRRMRYLRRSIRDADVFWWLDSFMRAAFTKDLNDFPLPDDYAPESEDHYFGPD
ncbi:MAG TPA: trehalose-6-phosphate synthase [Burkholderiales bacterium]|nr:trehalose-6-phosphate synthase [Burkholderiales bacterium]